MDILLATNNAHKVQEFTRIFTDHRIITPGQLGIEFEYIETGKTFLDNALGKAMTLHKLAGKRVIADDSGLCVPALGNAPGVYSARYGSGQDGIRLSPEQRNAFLLEQMQDITDRRAFFVCCMVLVFAEHRFFAAQETVAGIINHKPAGRRGFGYDPLFFLPQFRKTAAELEGTQKDSVSHRGKAARVILGHLELHPD